MTVETLSPLDLNVHYRQAIRPNHLSGSFAGDDQDNHDFVWEARGKSVVSFAINNATDKQMTWALYGMHASNGTVGDAGTFSIDSGTTAAGGQTDEGYIGYNYPYFLLRCSFSATPDGSTVNVYIDVSQG